MYDPADAEEAVMTDDKPNDEGLRHISFFRALLFKIWGPSDLGPSGPLAGTKYDPALKKQRELRRQEERRRQREGG
jgi:hypothetical protein